MNNIIPKDDTLERNRSMLRGEFNVHINDRIPFNEKVNAYTNEELSFYLY